MHIALWSPKGNPDVVRAYLNGIPCLSGDAKAFIAPAGPGISLTVTDRSLRSEVIAHLVEIGVLPSGPSPLDRVPFEAIASMASRRAAPSRPSRGQPARPERINVGTRHDEADRLDLSTIPVPDPITLRIDHREPAELFNLFAQLKNPNIHVERVELPVGDVEIQGENTCYVIERKACAPGEGRTDFEDSITGEGKRLFFQSEKMRLEEGIVPIVLLEGCAHEHSRGMLLQQVDGMLSYLITLQKCNVVTTYGLKHTAYFILKLAAHDRSGLMTQPSLRGKKPRLQKDQLAFVLEGLPSVSTGLAKELASRFGSLAALCQATEKELLAIKGLGPKRLAQIKGVLYGE